MVTNMEIECWLWTMHTAPVFYSARALSWSPRFFFPFHLRDLKTRFNLAAEIKGHERKVPPAILLWASAWVKHDSQSSVQNGEIISNRVYICYKQNAKTKGDNREWNSKLTYWCSILQTHTVEAPRCCSRPPPKPTDPARNLYGKNDPPTY